MKKISTAILAAVLGAGAQAAEINLAPGQLPECVAALAGGTDPSLTLTGQATAADLLSLATLPAHITSLDMSALNVAGCRVANGGRAGKTEFSDGELPPYMLFGTSVKKLSIPVSTVKIGEGAFASTPLESADLLQAAELGDGIFHDCTKLRTVDMASTLVSALPSRIFSGCRSLVSVSLPSGIRSVGQRAFVNSGIYSISLPDAVEIGDYAFADATSLSEIAFPSGCRMGEGVFRGDISLENISGNPAGIPVLYAANAGLASRAATVTGPQVSAGAFGGSSAQQFLFTSNVANVEAHAFSNLAQLKAIDVTMLGSSVPETSAEAFRGTDVTVANLFVAVGTAGVWKQAPVWRDFRISEGAGNPGLPSSVAEISVSRSGHLIYVAADVTLEEVTLYALDGKVLESFEPCEESCEIRIPEGNEIVVVRACGGGMTKVVKLKK